MATKKIMKAPVKKYAAGGAKKLVKKNMGGPGDPPKKIITANVSRYNNTGKPTGRRGLQEFKTTAETEYSKYPEGKVSDRYNDVAIGSTNNPAESYKIKSPDETAGRRKEGYLVEKTRAYTLPVKTLSQKKSPEKLQKGGVMKKMKTGGMVNSNTKVTASSTTKKPSKPRSKAPKKASPGRR